MAEKIALMGAGGKMGMRITNNLKRLPDYDVAYVEISEQGIAQLQDVHGVTVTSEDDALRDADQVVMALPDRFIGRVSHQIVPKLKSGSILMGLDPAAAYAEIIPIRDDITYFVAHPCHPPLFHDEVEDEKRTDWFGGVKASQHIVCALHRGPEEHYERGEKLAAAMYGPIRKSHRVTVEQMALLEPALVETFSASLIMAIREGYEEVVKKGVPAEAAWEFLMGHVRIELAVIFGFAGFPFSDGAKLAIQKAQGRIFREDWKEAVFDIENVKRSVLEIVEDLES